MSVNNEINSKLIYVIVSQGAGTKILHRAKTYGALGGAIFIAKGSANKALTNFFSLYEKNKEIVLLAAEYHKVNQILEELNTAFKFYKHNHGIAFTIKSNIIGFHINDNNDLEIIKGDKPMYKLITTIVNIENAEDVIETAKLAGAKGGTIINARGTLLNESYTIFGIEIEPRKEVVLIVAQVEDVELIITSIRKKLNIDKPGNGIIITQDIDNAYGLNKDKI